MAENDNSQLKTSKDSMKFSSTEHAQKILSNLNFLRKNSLFCDIEIKVGTRTFWAHKALLSASSCYFQAMFTSGLSETEKSQIELHQVNDKTFSLLIDFIYTGQMEISNLNVQDIIIAADMFQLTEIIETCSIFLKKQLHLSNCIGIRQFAETHSCLNLEKWCENFIDQNFIKIIKEEEFLNLDVKSVQKIFKSDKLEIDDEAQVFEAALNWLDRDTPDRLKHIRDVLQQVRLKLISKQQINTLIRSYDHLNIESDLNQLIENPTQTLPRAFARKCIFVIGGYNREVGQRWSESCTLSSAQVYDVPKKEWQKARAMQVARSGHGAALVNGKIYVIGGESDDSMIFSHCETYDPTDDKWDFIPNMVKSRTLHGVCAVDGLIYAFGGWIGSHLGESIECYDPDTKKWTECGLMETPRCAMGVVVNEGLIYLVGGLGDTLTEVNSVDRYDPCNLRWNKLPKMTASRAYAGAVVTGGFLYAIGGSGGGAEKGLSSVERYDLSGGKWEVVGEMNVKRVSPCVAGVDGIVYVMGGRTSSDEFSPATTLSQIECYDPRVGKWTFVGDMGVSCCDSAVVVM